MNDRIEYYRNFSTKGLIETVQTMAIRLSDPKVKKLKSTAAMRKQIEGLRELRSALQYKLGQMDRNTQAYFPIGCHVLHTPPSLYEWDDFDHTEEPPKNAVVIAHEEDGRITVKREGEEYFTKTWPAHLKLRFIRDNT